MNDELEMRLRSAFRAAALPAAPASLSAVLDAVTAEGVRPASGPRSNRRSWGLLAVAAVLAIGGAVALSIGNRGPNPAPPTAAPTASSSASTEPEPTTATRLTFEPQWSPEIPFTVDDLAAIASIAQQRIDATGAVGVIVSTDDAARVIVDIPAGIDPQPLADLVGTTGRIAFVPVGQELPAVGSALDPVGFPPLFEGSSVTDASVAPGQTGDPGLELRLSGDAATRFGEYTASHIGESFAITLDSVVVSVPMIVSAVSGGDVRIEFGADSSFDVADLNALATVIRFGPLPVPLVQVAGGPAPSAEATAAPAVICEAPLDVEGPQLDCHDAVDAALAILPAGHPAIAEVTFVHECNDVRVEAIPDCYVQAFGVVTVTFADGSPPVRIGLSLGSAPSIIPPLPTPSG